MTNRKTWLLFVATLLIFMIAYATADARRTKSRKKRKARTEVVVDTVVADTLLTDSLGKSNIYQTGKATFYGDGWHGRKCASGERYDKNDYTCAHRTLPFGSLIKVTNTRNGQSAVVRVIDRGPFGKGKVIDLSKAAARKIGMLGHGIVTVNLELVPAGTPVKDGEIVPADSIAPQPDPNQSQ